MRKLTVVFAALLVVALAAPSSAGIDEGDWEVQLGGQFFISDFISNYGISLSLGYFVTPEIEVGGYIMYAQDDWDGEVEFKNERIGDLEFTIRDWNMGAFAAYYFETDGEWRPYVGGFLGYESGVLDFGGGDEFKRNDFAVGGFVGVKFFISEKATIFIEYRLQWRFEDEWELDDDSAVTVEDDAISHLFMIGLSVFF